MKNVLAITCIGAIFATFTMASIASLKLLNPQQNDEKAARDAALQIVQQYVSLSAEGKYDDLRDLTIEIPSRFLKREVVNAPVGATVVAAPEGSKVRSELDYVRNVFAKSIFDGHQKIVMIGDSELKADLIKLKVHLGNDQKFMLLPWVFILAREGPKAPWKIFTITTPAYAEDYQ